MRTPGPHRAGRAVSSGASVTAGSPKGMGSPTCEATLRRRRLKPVPGPIASSRGWTRTSRGFRHRINSPSRCHITVYTGMSRADGARTRTIRLERPAT